MARHWAAWVAASVAAHAVVLAGLFLQLPLPTAGARAAIVSVQLVAMGRTHAPTKSMPAHIRKPVPARASRVNEHRSQRRVPAVAGLTRHAAIAHVRRLAARAKPVKPPLPTNIAAAPTASPPSAMSEVSAHDMSLVRRHLERFKFYPMSARRRGIGGDVEVGFRLTAGGKAEQVRVLTSSGHDILDEAALQTVSRAQPFPVDAGKYRFRLRFRSL